MMGAKTFKENIGIKILHETASILGYKLVPKPSSRKPNEKTILGFCKELLDKYHIPFKKVRKWYETIYHEVKTTKMLKSPLGHVRYFFGDIEKDHNMLRSAVAHQPQNLSVAILNIGFWKIYKQMVVQPVAPLKLGDFRLKAQIHDSILAQYRKELKEYCVKMMMRLMDNPVEVKGRELRIPVDAKTGTVWGKCEDFISE
jgi:DNA polymerase I-like protein with 3'-5' exonuclease and polymerase domains